MKIKLLMFVIILHVVLTGCSNLGVSNRCSSLDLENDIEIDFFGKEPRTFIMSPFEKNKIIIDFVNYKMIEYDLITKDTHSIDRNLRRIYLSDNLYFRNLQDSIVWIASENALFKYDIRTKEISETSISSVSRILRYKSRTYFFAYKEIFLKEDGSDEIRKVQNLPDSIKLDGVNIHDNTRWQMIKNLYSYKYRIPKVNKYVPIYYYDNNIIWISRPGQLFFIDTETSKKYNIQNDQYISLIYDDCYIYLLYKNKLHVQLKSEFINSCSEFDESKYLAELSTFNKFMDSIAIRLDRNEMSVLNKYRKIEDRYQSTTHPEILEQLKYLEFNAFQSVFYETNTEYQDCYTNEELPVFHRIGCFKNLISNEIRKSNYEEALAYEKESIVLFEAKDLEQSGYFYSDMDDIQRYLFHRDSLKNLQISKDTLDYLQSMALNIVCKTRFYSTESGMNDFQLVKNRLLNFIKEHPNSEYRDNAEFWLINYEYIGNLEVDLEQVREYEIFKKKFPSSDLLVDVDYGILSLLFMSEEPIDEVGFLNKCKGFLSKYPNFKRIDNVKQFISEIKISRSNK